MPEEWQVELSKSVNSPDELARFIPLSPAELRRMRRVVGVYPMRISPHYLTLIREKNGPLWKQMVPDIKELRDKNSPEDPLHEDTMSPVPNLTHRYPDRVLFLVSSECAAYCRFCTRKRKVGKPYIIRPRWIREGLRYIESTSSVRDVILSGGDPLLLSDAKLEFLLKSLRRIRHVEIVRIGTRVPCTFPQRITQKLCRVLKRYHPLFVNVHFNHPDELTSEARTACEMLSDAGIPLGNQTVLLKGVNDDAETLRSLFCGLLRMRVRPYYLYQCDLTRGTRHFRTRVEKGIEIINKLRGHISGLAIPHFVIDAPGGGGKIPLLPEYCIELSSERVLLRNYRGLVYSYPQPGTATVQTQKIDAGS